jgi:hypothetical protein
MMGFSVLLAAATLAVVIRTAYPPAGLVIDTLTVHADGSVRYARTSRVDHWARWHAEVFAPGLAEAVCEGGGVDRYEVGTKQFQWTISEFIGGDCPNRLEPGWIVAVEWVPVRPDLAPIKRAVAVEECPECAT